MNPSVRLTGRVVSAWLSLSLALPSPAHALKVQAALESSGLEQIEEKLRVTTGGLESETVRASDLMADLKAPVNERSPREVAVFNRVSTNRAGDRLSGGLEAFPVTPEVFASLMDHTNLNASATQQQIQQTARETRDRGYALVAVRTGHRLLRELHPVHFSTTGLAVWPGRFYFC